MKSGKTKIPALLKEAQTACARMLYRRKAEYPEGTYDSLAAILLREIHAGRVDEAFQLTSSEDEDGEGRIPLAALAVAIRRMDGSALKQFGDALDRLRSRASGEGAAFKIAPDKPEKLEVLNAVLSSGSVPLSAEDLSKHLAQQGCHPLSPTQARRDLKELGAKTRRRGRPSKVKIPSLKRPAKKESQEKLREAVAMGKRAANDKRAARGIKFAKPPRPLGGIK